MRFLKIDSDFENPYFRHFSLKLCAFCDQLMHAYITLTPYMLLCYLYFIPFLRTSGSKKSILFGNKIKVKTNIWVLMTCIFTSIHSEI